MEDIAISYQQLFEVNFIHSALPKDTLTRDWVQLVIDTTTQQQLNDHRLTIRPSDNGWRLLTVAKALNQPACDIQNLTLRMGFVLSATAAANQQLPAHFVMPPPDNSEGRYLFGNIIARSNGDTFPDISTPSKIDADYSANQRYFGYLEMFIGKGTTDFDILDNTGKIRFVKGQPQCKFQITFHK